MSSLSNFVKRLRDIMRNDAGINGDAQRIEQIAWLLFLKVYDTKEEDWEFDDDAYESIIPEDCRWRNWAVDDGKGTALTGDDLLDFVNNTLFPTLKGIQVSKTTPINKAIVKTTFEDTNNYMKDGVLLRQVVNVIDELDLTNYAKSTSFLVLPSLERNPSKRTFVSLRPRKNSLYIYQGNGKPKFGFSRYLSI